MKPFAAFAALAALSLAALPAAHAADTKPTPVLVELFTSEGCSSCPSADAVLEKLTTTQPVAGAEIIALGYHVDYWNYLGWRDPFSSAIYSDRQEKYQLHFRNDNVYTPQMIVAGSAEFVGSDEGRARQEIATAAARAKSSAVSVALAPAGGDRYTVHFTGVSGRPVRLFLAVTEDGLVSQVARGENAGRRLPHIAVVRRLQHIASANPTTVTLPVATGERREKQHIVAWAQEGETGAILAATQIAR